MCILTGFHASIIVQIANCDIVHKGAYFQRRQVSCTFACRDSITYLDKL